MATIHSHQWLEIHEVGLEASQSRLLRVEERELLLALRSAPVRVVDLFRRLRVTDGQAFQDVLGKAVSRGWLVVHDFNPSGPVAEKPEPESAALSSEDALGALLAKYAQEQEQASDDLGVAAPEWERPAVAEDAPGSPMGTGHSDEVVPVPLPDDALSEENQESSFSEEPPSSVPKEPAAPVYVETPKEGADELFAAMGLDPGQAEKLLPPAPQEPAASRAKETSPSWGGNQALLDALSAASPSFPASSSVSVPEYGLAPPAPADPQDNTFVRLKDVGAVFGPGERADDSGGTGTPVPAAPDQDVLEDPTTRTRRRRSARERMLEAARREEADRQAARDRARQLQERKAAEEAQRKETIARQRAAEDMARGPSFLSRAEKARRIRDGVPPKSD